MDSSSPLLKRLPAIFSVLYKPSILLVLFAFACLKTLLFYNYFWIIVLSGVELTVYFHIAKYKEMSFWTLLDFDCFELVVRPSVLVVMATSPMLIALYFMDGQFSFTLSAFTISWQPLPLLLFSVGVGLFPLLLTVAIIDGRFVSMVSPALWWKMLNALGTNYAVAWCCFYVLMAIELFLLSFSFPINTSFIDTVLLLLTASVPRLLRYSLLGELCRTPMRNTVLPSARVQ